MDTAGWESANVMGVSEGAAMAQHFAVRHPDRVEKLILASGGAPPAHLGQVQELSGDAFREFDELRADFGAIAEVRGEDPVAFCSADGAEPARQ